MFRKNTSNHRLFILLLIFWHTLIFLLSSIPDLQSGLPGFWDFILRKYAHAFEFGVLTTLWLAVLTNSRVEPCTGFNPAQGLIPYTLAGILTFFWAVLDEFHQTFVPGRVGHPLDVLVDSSGILLALFLSRRITGLNPVQGSTLRKV